MKNHHSLRLQALTNLRRSAGYENNFPFSCPQLPQIGDYIQNLNDLPDQIDSHIEVYICMPCANANKIQIAPSTASRPSLLWSYNRSASPARKPYWNPLEPIVGERPSWDGGGGEKRGSLVKSPPWANAAPPGGKQRVEGKMMLPWLLLSHIFLHASAAKQRDVRYVPTWKVAFGARLKALTWEFCTDGCCVGGQSAWPITIQVQ